MSHKSYREESKLDWGTKNGAPLDSLAQIQTGAILRIADATEKIAHNYVNMLVDVELLQRIERQQRDEINRLQRRISALKGVITKKKGGAL